MLTMSLMRKDTRIINSKTDAAPIAPAITKDKFEFKILIFNKEEPITTTATPKLAPLLIPKIEGPAKGFLNKDCITKPATDNAAPHNIAAITRGKRNSLNTNEISSSA